LAWKIDYTDSARKELRKMDRQQARRLLDFMDKRIAVLENPREHGKALSGPLGSFWRYRLGDYRIICDIRDNALCVLVIRIGNRNAIYR
jgi:mRNA interferase RelE/StbE